ncbi:hypothetical protein C0993_008669 [Termitomyces sp. T159_Od127]|nr:hypothetical protein C0993_008669 [Termitomyces sp. T159_Od127]
MMSVRPPRRIIDLTEDAVAVAAGLIPRSEGAGMTYVSTTDTDIEVPCLVIVVADGHRLMTIMIARGTDLDLDVHIVDRGQGHEVILPTRRGAIHPHQAQVADRFVGGPVPCHRVDTRVPILTIDDRLTLKVALLALPLAGLERPRRRHRTDQLLPPHQKIPSSPSSAQRQHIPLAVIAESASSRYHILSTHHASIVLRNSVSLNKLRLPSSNRMHLSGNYEPPLSRRPSHQTDFTRGTTPPHIVPPPSHGAREQDRMRDEDGPLPVPGRPVGERTPSQRQAEIPREEHPPTPVPHPTSVRSTAQPLPPQRSPPHRAVTPAHGDFGREEEHIQRLQDAEQLVHNAAQSILGADRDRERDFRLNEEDRDRVFQEGEARRHQEAQERAEAIWQEFRDRIATLPLPVPVQSPPSPPSPPPVGTAVAQTEDVADRASIHSQAQVHTAVQMLDTIAAERAEFAREREAAAQEREMLKEELNAAHRSQVEAQDARIKELEDELAAVRAELENEKQQRLTIETEQRERESQALQERDEAIRNQLGDITNIVQGHQLACDEKNARMEERWQEKQMRRADKDQKMEALENLVRKLAQEMEESRDLALEAKIARERSPSLQDIIQKLEEQNAAQQAMLEELSKGWREDCARYHEETIARVEETAHQQVEFNIQGYLDEFSKALASEVRMLLGEVGKLREERRALQ